MGRGPQIAAEELRQRGIQFVQADLSALPFSDKQFNFAYCHHAFEHIPDPQKACAEMCRVAEAGAIITPSIFAEIAFGRPYHLWFVMARSKRIVFIHKTQSENQPFGNIPEHDANGVPFATSQTNPFELLLNYNDWYHGPEQIPRLSSLMQKYWYSHSPVMEVVFLWKDYFDCTVIDSDGLIT